VSKFEAVVLGVGDTFSEVHYGASLLLQCDGVNLAIDCPDLYRSVLRSAAESSRRSLSLSDIDHMLITHVHGDHMNGLEGVAFFKHFAETKRVKLVTSPEARASIWTSACAAWAHFGRRGYRARLDSYFDHTPLSWTDRVEIGPSSLPRGTIHHVPTSALVKPGRTLATRATPRSTPSSSPSSSRRTSSSTKRTSAPRTRRMPRWPRCPKASRAHAADSDSTVRHGLEQHSGAA
jgi:hypothetical protein